MNMDEEQMPALMEQIIALMQASSVTVIEPEDKFIIHVNDPHTPTEVMKGMADVLTSIFGPDRSVVLVGDSVHINVVRGKNEQD
jgi:hypothetical protein